jgi:carboxypeptidase family protein
MRTTAYWPRRAALMLVIVGTIALLSGCRRAAPATLERAHGPEPKGRVSGIVHGPQGADPFDGRPVEVVNMATGARQRTMTTSGGRFAFRLPPGKYRVELSLRPGESILRQPELISVGPSDVEARAEFVVSATRTTHPRYTPSLAEAGLGSPIA